MNKSLHWSSIGTLLLVILFAGLIVFWLQWTRQPGALPTGQALATNAATVEVLPSPTPPVVETEQINTQPYPPPPILTPTPILTPSPTPLPTSTPLPYDRLTVVGVEPVETGPYAKILWSPDGKKGLISKQYAVQHLLVRDKQAAQSDQKDLMLGTTVGLGDLWLFDTATKTEQQLFQQVGRFSWSPDSSKIAYINPTEPEGIAGLLSIYDLTTNETKALIPVDFLGSDYEPQWLATGEIVYVRDGQIWSIQPDGTQERSFLDLKFFSWVASEAGKDFNRGNHNAIVTFQISPDGKTLAYLTPNEDERAISSKLWLATVETNQHSFITNQAIGFDWSPDSAWLALHTYRDLTDPFLDERMPVGSMLWLIKADGTERQLLHQFEGWGGQTSIAWSPDHTKLAFILWESKFEGNDTTLWLADLTQPSYLGPMPAANPNNEGLANVWWEPQGGALLLLKEKIKGTGNNYIIERVLLGSQ